MIPNEQGIIADSGYTGPEFITPISLAVEIKVNSTAHARHKTVNERLKNFSFLSHVFRHRLERHKEIFYTVLNILELLFSSSDSLFKIDR